MATLMIRPDASRYIVSCPSPSPPSFAPLYRASSAFFRFCCAATIAAVCSAVWSPARAPDSMRSPSSSSSSCSTTIGSSSPAARRASSSAIASASIASASSRPLFLVDVAVCVAVVRSVFAPDPSVFQLLFLLRRNSALRAPATTAGPYSSVSRESRPAVLRRSGGSSSAMMRPSVSAVLVFLRFFFGRSVCGKGSAVR
ncbi:hypothetical protein BDW74DRAFT_161241 [Aspergillus multicolor]|uniref:uncharacterized protein n=1 Tax=Aspergillus multicolor TaxID=41759 RepID=UPI003CCD56FE